MGTTTADIEENHPKYQMMKGILRIDSNLGTIILLSMQKKSRKIHGFPPQQQPHIETLKKYIFFQRPPVNMLKIFSHIKGYQTHTKKFHPCSFYSPLYGKNSEKTRT